MFKFMKSKKGFTLVELMIVVVIMAILVAVAVPIFSAVTANARKKTCIGNQRNIISQINNQVMSGAIVLEAGATDLQITFQTNDAGDKLAEDGIVVADGLIDIPEDSTDTAEDIIAGLFSEANQPICPVGGGLITAVVSNSGDGSCTINVYCNSNDEGNNTAGTTVGDLGHEVK